MTDASTSPVGVVLLQFGGPDSLEAVEPFLYNLFNDRDIITFPFGPRFQKVFAKGISKRRAPTVAEKYGEIGGKSPIVQKTLEQTEALQARFLREPLPFPVRVIHAMRYWKPFTEEAVNTLTSEGIRDIVLLPLYAQYSKTNAGSSYNEWDRVTKRLGVTFSERRIEEYRSDGKYLQALSERIDQALAKFPDPSKVRLLFTAHGTPVDMVFGGDPYVYHIRDTMEALMRLRGDDLPYQLSFQSKVGPKQWLTPSTFATFEELGNEGVKDLLVIPIAFVSDHIETLHELEIEGREVTDKAGIERMIVMEGLNDYPLFIEALFDLAMKEIAILRPNEMKQ
ncbi:MAG: ferrochelatase [Candidatus Kapaibacterium sp.]|jgi:ferrochelatase